MKENLGLANRFADDDCAKQSHLNCSNSWLGDYRKPDGTEYAIRRDADGFAVRWSGGGETHSDVYSWKEVKEFYGLQGRDWLEESCQDFEGFNSAERPTIADMSPEGRKLLGQMKEVVAAYQQLINWTSALFVFKKMLDEPLALLLELVLPTPSEWDALSELISKSAGLRGILKNKLKLLFVTYATNNHWNAADRAFIESFYYSFTKDS